MKKFILAGFVTALVVAASYVFLVLQWSYRVVGGGWSAELVVQSFDLVRSDKVCGEAPASAVILKRYEGNQLVETKKEGLCRDRCETVLRGGKRERECNRVCDTITDIVPKKAPFCIWEEEHWMTKDRRTVRGEGLGVAVELDAIGYPTEVAAPKRGDLRALSPAMTYYVDLENSWFSTKIYCRFTDPVPWRQLRVGAAFPMSRDTLVLGEPGLRCSRGPRD